jgi:hypothetical protein
MEMKLRVIYLYFLVLALFTGCAPKLERNILDFYQTYSVVKNLLLGSPQFSFYYPENTKILTLGEAITITPIANKEIVSCTITPELPVGLNLASNCTISGTPTVISSSTIYLVQGVDASSTFATNITLSVLSQAPSSLVYPNSPFVFSLGLPIAQQVPSYTGTITSCTSTPALPPGLLLTPNCTLEGTPSTLQAISSYTISGSNSYGTISTMIQITISATPPSALNYSGSPYIFTINTMIPTITPTFTGTITSCSASPALPTGLTINPSNCALSGTPTSLQSATNHLITASNAFGSTTYNITISVLIAPPSSLNYAGNPYIFTQGLAISTITPTYSGTITSCSASPALPTGLGINNATCEITGTPSNVQSSTDYTITASNSSGSTTTTINITINIAPPDSLTYTGSPFTFTQNTTIPTLSPTTLNGTVTSCTASPSLPVGLGINNSTCAITGTPTTVQAATNYTITASNSSGSTSTNISIQISLAPPANLTYPSSSYAFTMSIPITPVTPTFTGTVTNCVSSPPLPTGLAINPTTCTISGNPTVLQPATSYTITASNTSGSTTATISIQVVLLPPANLVYSGSPFEFIQNEAILPVTPTFTGTVTNCVSAPPLPTGLAINPTTCVITGTPTTTQASTDYTITASNGYGSTTTTISIKIVLPGKIYFSNYDGTTSRGGRYGNARKLTGSSITNFGNTGLSLAIALDETRDILYMAGSTASETTIFVFKNASTNSGTSPITLTHSSITRVAGLAIDPVNDVLYAVTFVTSGAYTNRNIIRITSASTKTSLSAPNEPHVATSTVLHPDSQGVRRIVFDNQRNLLYVCEYGQHKIFVFDNAHTITGLSNTISPAREITGIAAPAGIDIDIPNDILYVSSFSGNSVSVLNNASTQQNAAVISRTITSAQFSNPAGLRYIPSLNRLYVSNFGLGSISYFENANSINGFTNATGTLTGITNITDVSIDLSR